MTAVPSINTSLTPEYLQSLYNAVRGAQAGCNPNTAAALDSAEALALADTNLFPKTGLILNAPMDLPIVRVDLEQPNDDRLGISYRAADPAHKIEFIGYRLNPDTTLLIPGPVLKTVVHDGGGGTAYGVGGLCWMGSVIPIKAGVVGHFQAIVEGFMNDRRWLSFYLFNGTDNQFINPSDDELNINATADGPNAQGITNVKWSVNRKNHVLKHFDPRSSNPGWLDNGNWREVRIATWNNTTLNTCWRDNQVWNPNQAGYRDTYGTWPLNGIAADIDNGVTHTFDGYVTNQKFVGFETAKVNGIIQQKRVIDLTFAFPLPDGNYIAMPTTKFYGDLHDRDYEQDVIKVNGPNYVPNLWQQNYTVETRHWHKWMVETVGAIP